MVGPTRSGSSPGRFLDSIPEPDQATRKLHAAEGLRRVRGARPASRVPLGRGDGMRAWAAVVLLLFPLRAAALTTLPLPVLPGFGQHCEVTSVGNGASSLSGWCEWFTF